MKTEVIVICGPTASGKSNLAISLAKQLDSEIICADALTVYKNLNVGTAKPTIKEMNGIKHHMLDVVDVFSTFSVGDYKEIATPILENLFSKGKTPIICGGTGFYINSLLFEMSYGKVSANLETREKYLTLAKENGNQYLYNILKDVDPKSAEKIHFNDIKRVVRALEICESGIKKSDICDSIQKKYNFKAFCYDYEREKLYNRINQRVDFMIKNGLVDEVKSLIKSGVTISNQCMQGIGYKEVYSYLMGEISLNDAVELIKLNTRHYAKRQITFFKKLPNLITLQASSNLTETVKGIINLL